MHLLIFFPLLEIYLVAAEQWGPLQCSISWNKQLKLCRASKLSTKCDVIFLFLVRRTLKLQPILSSTIAAFKDYFYFFRLFQTEVWNILYSNSKSKHTKILFESFLSPLLHSPLQIIWTPEGLVLCRMQTKNNKGMSETNFIAVQHCFIYFY